MSSVLKREEMLRIVSGSGEPEPIAPRRSNEVARLNREHRTIEEQRRMAVLTGSMLDAETALRLSAGVTEKRDHARYNSAQSNEKAAFRAALYHLAQSLREEEKCRGERASTDAYVGCVLYHCLQSLRRHFGAQVCH